MGHGFSASRWLLARNIKDGLLASLDAALCLW
jgi:hypothetical protein